MNNRKMIMQALLCFVLILGMVIPTPLFGASSVDVPAKDDVLHRHSMDDVLSVPSGLTLNAPQGQVTPMVAAGNRHTVGLTSDGMVIGAGDLQWQPSMRVWNQIITIDAGVSHTVGVRADGTVVAAGPDSHGSVDDVWRWTGIEQVAAGWSHTVGLKVDGTVVAVGSNSRGQCDIAGWTGITQVAAGHDHTVGLKYNGTVVAVGQNTHGQCNTGDWSDIIQVAAAQRHTVGLRSDGTVVATGSNTSGQCDLDDWTDVIQVAAGGQHTVGLLSNGTVVAKGSDMYGQCNVGNWAGVVQVDAGQLHTVALMSDGSVAAVGWEDDGQCEVADWSLSETTARLMTEIWDWYDLSAMRDRLDGDYVLMNDLDSATAGYLELASPMANDGSGWQPLGGSDSQALFSGTFDGQGHEVRDIFINRPDEPHVGLFGRASQAGVIIDIVIVGANVIGGNYVGGLIGSMSGGALVNCYASGKVAGDSYVGGLVGSGGWLMNCWASVDVTGSVRVGGLVGTGARLTNCCASGDVTGSVRVGGLVGSGARARTCYASGDVIGSSNVGGLVGYDGSAFNSYYNYDEVLINGENVITTGALFGDDFKEWLANGKYLDIDERLSQEDGYYEINNVADFKQVLIFGQHPSLRFKLTTDLDLSGHPNFVIPYLTGEFHGNGHTILNASFSFGFVSQVGLFGHLRDGTIRSLSVDNVNITGYEDVGGVVGRIDHGTLLWVTCTGSVVGSSRVGGLVGQDSGWLGRGIANSNSAASVTGDFDVGGLVGRASQDIVNSYSAGVATGRSHVGGLVGSNWGTVRDSYSTGGVTGEYNTGGVVGLNWRTVRDSYSTGSVTGEYSTGGLVGWNDGGMVTDSYFAGSVTGTTYVSGLVGMGGLGVDRDHDGYPIRHYNNSYYNYDEVLINGENVITAGALFDDDFKEWLANDKHLDVDQRLSQEDGYYLINSVADFKQLLIFGQDHSLRFKLTTDLDLSGHPNFVIPYLTGEFHGNGHTISNPSFSFDFISYVGLFGYVAPGAVVTQVGADGIDIAGHMYVGGLVGDNLGTVSATHSTGTVTGEKYVGGLVGRQSSGRVTRYDGGQAEYQYTGSVSSSYFEGSVTGGSYVGGLVGQYAGVVSLTASYSSAMVTGDNIVGGLVGVNWGTVSNSHCSGIVTGDDAVGGLVGINSGSVSNCYARVTVIRTPAADRSQRWVGQRVGGFVGSNNGEVTNCYSVGIVQYANSKGPTNKGFAGRCSDELAASFWDIQTSLQTSTAGDAVGKTTMEMQDIATYIDTETIGMDHLWDIVAVPFGHTNTEYTWNIVDGHTYPFLSWERAVDLHEVQDWHDLDAIRYNLRGHYFLTNNLDSATSGYEHLAGQMANQGMGWEPVGGTIAEGFMGSFDGQGYEIRDLFIYRPNESIVGLLGCVGPGGFLSNLGLVHSDVTGDMRVGGLAGLNNGSVSDSYYGGEVIGTDDIGGLIGWNAGIVSDSYSTATVTGQDHVGGLAGWNAGALNNCHHINSVSGNRAIGGLVGHNDHIVSNSHSSGSVSGSQAVGGLIGSQEWSTVSNSHSSGSVSGSQAVGGLIGSHEGGTVSNCHFDGSVSGSQAVGGLVGSQYQGTVTSSHCTVSVTAGDAVGGLVGWNQGWVTRSFSAGDVTGEMAVGGLVGWNEDSYDYWWWDVPELLEGQIDRSYSNASVTGQEYVGGLVGWNHGTVNNSYATGDVGGEMAVGGLVGWNEGAQSDDPWWDPVCKGIIMSSYSMGSVTAYERPGGLVGWSNELGIVFNAFWDMETSGMTESDGGTGKTTAQMMEVTTFLGAAWDIVAVDAGDFDSSHTWNIVDGQTYPFLCWEMMLSGAPIARASDISGQPKIMYPNAEYTITAKYFDPDGREDLKYCYLRLLHPDKPLTMMWSQATDDFWMWAGEEGENYLTTVSGNATPITEGGLKGYKIAWTFNISDQWPEVEDAIDFGVYAWDDGDLQSGWDYDDTKASFSLVTNRPPDPPTELRQYEGFTMSEIGVGGSIGSSIRHNRVVLSARLTDPDNDDVKLQIELRRLDDDHVEILESSDYWESGGENAPHCWFDATGGKYAWAARAVDVHGLAGEWVEFGDNDPLDTDFAYGYEPHPYGYSFGNRAVEPGTLTGGVGSGFPDFWNQYIIEGDKWDIFRQTFDLKGIDEKTQIQLFKDLKLNEDNWPIGACYGMALSSAMQYVYRWYIFEHYRPFYNVLEGKGRLIWNLDDPPHTGGDVKKPWAGSDIGANPVLQAILSFQLSVGGTSSQAALAEAKRSNLTSPTGILDKLSEALPNDGSPRGAMYVLNIGYRSWDIKWDGFDTMRVPYGHSVVPYKVVENRIYVYDNNYPYREGHTDKAEDGSYRQYIEIDRDNDTWQYRFKEDWVWPESGPLTRPKIELLSLDTLHNEGALPRPRGAGGSEAVFYLDGSGALLLTDSEGRSTGLTDGSFTEEIPDVWPIYDYHTVSGEVDQVWRQAYYEDEDTDLTATVQGIEDGQYSMTKYGPGYFATICDVPIGEGGVDELVFTSDSIEIRLHENQPPKTYTLILNKNMDGVSQTFAAPTIPIEGTTVHLYTVDWDAFCSGEDGVTVRVDSNGNGEFDYTFTVGSLLTGDEFRLRTETFIDFDPNILNLRARSGLVTVYIELPEGFDVRQIDVSSIRLNGFVPALSRPTAIGDYNGNGIPDLMVKFDRSAVNKVVEAGESVEITITGEVGGITFMGTDTIRVIG